MVLAEFNANHKVHRIYRVVEGRVVGCGHGLGTQRVPELLLYIPIGGAEAVVGVEGRSGGGYWGGRRGRGGSWRVCVCVGVPQW